MILVIPEEIPFIKTAKLFVVVESELELISETRLEAIPFIVEVKLFVVVEIIFEFTKVVVADIPLIVLVITFATDDRVLLFTKFVVVVLITPFTLLVIIKLLEVVATDKVFVVAEEPVTSLTSITSPLAFTLNTFPLPVVVAEVDSKLVNLSPELPAVP